MLNRFKRRFKEENGYSSDEYIDIETVNSIENIELELPGDGPDQACLENIKLARTSSKGHASSVEVKNNRSPNNSKNLSVKATSR